jgi:hypothetical protein
MEEIWKPIVGYEGLYEVSNLGRVKSCERIIPSKLLKLQLSKEGYLRVHLSGPRKYANVHTLVLSAFSGEKPKGNLSRHLDGVRTHNGYDNLKWGTQKENMADRVRHGTDFKGSRHPNSKLTESSASEIRRLAESGVSKVKIAKMFGISPANVGHVVKRKSWTHI